MSVINRWLFPPPQGAAQADSASKHSCPSHHNTDKVTSLRDHNGTLDPDRVPALSLAPELLLKGLLVAVGVLIVLGIVSNQLSRGGLYEFSYTFMQLFDLDKERSVPTWFSSSLLFSNALLLTVVALSTLREHDRWRLYWCGLAFAFFMLSMDEVAGFHEKTMVPIREAWDLSGALYFAWVIPAMACLVVFGGLYLRFTFDLPRRTFWMFVVSGVLYIGGALGMEMVGSIYVSNFVRVGIVYGWIVIVEESLEMLGQILFFYGLADFIRSRWRTVGLRFEG